MEHDELLKDCPFCGDKAVIGEGADHAYVTCRNCACATPVCSTVEQAIDIWNTRATDATKRREPETPYLKLHKSLYDVIQMTCALCKTKHCEPAQSECSGIAEAKEALAEPARNCDMLEDYRNASCAYLKSHPGLNQNVSSWGWADWYDFALWLFKNREDNRKDDQVRI